jgi:hypothetical protein
MRWICANCGAQKQPNSKHYQCCGYIGKPILDTSNTNNNTKGKENGKISM